MSALPKIRDFDDPDYDPFKAMGEIGGENRVGDCYPELARLRAISPVFDGDIRQHFGLAPDLTMQHRRQVAILGHREVTLITRSPELYSNKIYDNNLGVYFGRSVTTMDQPEHARYRRLFQHAFSPRRVQEWAAERIPRMINRLIDDFEPRGAAELIGDFTLHFPFHFIHELMGLPIEDRPVFHKLAFGQIAISFDKAHGMDAADKLRDYLTELVLSRRAHPLEGDFVSALATGAVDGETLPDDVVISFFRQLMNAGGDTSYHGFSSVLACLLEHPDQLAAVRRDRSLVTPAIEEGLRWNCPVLAISRTPVRQVEIAGVAIDPGDHMSLILGAANRDPAVFPDPDRFDIFRGPQLNYAFGSGSHLCIGRHLARLEMTIALDTLLDRLPRLRVDERFPKPQVTGFALRGPHELHVRFD